MLSATARAYAKINLGLEILGRRSDGFHELRTIFQTISLHDTVSVRMASRGGSGRVSLSVEGLDAPAGVDNLAVRAAGAMCAALGTKPRVEIHLVKRVPTGGGLGGGSSDAAAVLRILDLLSGRKLPRHTLFRIAARLGSDVPFFLFGGRAIGIGRGEEVYPLPDGPSRHCLLALPEQGMNTAEAYRLLNAPAWPPAHPVKAVGKERPAGSQKLTPPVAHPTIDSFCAWLLAEAGGGAAGKANPVGNDFQPVVFGRFPELAAAVRIMARSGAEWAALTGSGSAIYGLFVDGKKARTAYRRLESRGMRLFLCRTVRRLPYERSLSID